MTATMLLRTAAPLGSLRAALPLRVAGGRRAPPRSAAGALLPRAAKKEAEAETPKIAHAAARQQPSGPPEAAKQQRLPAETRLASVAPTPLFSLAAAEGLRQSLEPVGDLVRSFDLPEWLVHWGHPGNMLVVLLAMGGYGSYLGWQIKLAGDAEARLKAKEAHPKIMAGMFFFFALGATGGITSLVTQGQPILDSPHAYTGLIGLGLLTAQAVLSSNFKGNPDFRSIHAYLGSATMALFLVHAALGLKLGLSI